MEAARQPAKTAFDLDPLIKALLRRRDERNYFAAGNALKTFRDCQSSVNDLIFAMEVLSFLRAANAGSAGRELPAAVQGALMAQVILLYVRATAPSGERKSLKLLSLYDQKQKELHKKLEKLRNKVIAHLDYDRSIGSKSFADEVLVLVHNGDGSHRLQLADMRVAFQHGLANELSDLLEMLLAECQGIMDQRLSDAVRHVGELSKVDPEIAKLIERQPLDAFGFFGNETNANAFLERGAVGVVVDRQPLAFED